ncbi:hypothetical protein PHMEG_00023266 [Phytophthora megakarya]|uniref:Uncharacterized protein n=1 Tax=Phytophthora megakarya TaxID=4795 RepID=A0A225VIU8_9STRA|nr:hypothetical protein PHMEG_00023266 [Phytophthora megakarya]
MFHDRIIVFYFHEVRGLNSEALDGIKNCVDFMRVNAKTWWAILHWLTISFLSRDAADTDASRALYDERRRDVKRLRVQYEALLKRLFAIPGFPKTLLYEPGLWTLPVCACHWILKDPEYSPLIRRGVPAYAAQLDDLDAEDPVRTQWAAAHSDDDILASVPSFMHPFLMMHERRVNSMEGKASRRCSELLERNRRLMTANCTLRSRVKLDQLDPDILVLVTEGSFLFPRNVSSGGNSPLTSLGSRSRTLHLLL